MNIAVEFKIVRHPQDALMPFRLKEEIAKLKAKHGQAVFVEELSRDIQNPFVFYAQSNTGDFVATIDTTGAFMTFVEQFSNLLAERLIDTPETRNE